MTGSSGTGRTAAALCGALAVAGCGGSGAGGPAPGGPHWNMADACKTLSQADIEAASGLKVRETADNVASVVAGLKVASCTWKFTNGGAMTLMTRVTDDPLTDADIASLRDAGGMMPPGEEAPGLGMKAFYSDKTRQLQLFTDRKHYAGLVYGPPLTMPGAPTPPGPDPRALATTLARKLL